MIFDSLRLPRSTTAKSAAAYCPVGRRLQYLHRDALVVHGVLECASQEATYRVKEEGLEAVRRLRKEAVELFIEHLAACAHCRPPE
jgi:hypothetical protein